MRLRSEQDVLALFPEALIGVVHVRGCDNAVRDPRIEAQLRQAEAGARAGFAGSVLAEEPRIACWREAYRRFGASPKKSPSSIENLLRRVTRGETMRPINPLVDL
jgi:DNA/RNA-binding domain of Phe-tRNA-synthetase-like protein